MKAAFTSGFINTMTDQMPIGRPTMQQGPMQGIIATMLATTAIVQLRSCFIIWAALQLSLIHI